MTNKRDGWILTVIIFIAMGMVIWLDIACPFWWLQMVFGGVAFALLLCLLFLAIPMAMDDGIGASVDRSIWSDDPGDDGTLLILGPDPKYGAVEVPYGYCWKFDRTFPRNGLHDNDGVGPGNRQCDGPHSVMWASR